METILELDTEDDNESWRELAEEFDYEPSVD